MNATSGPLKKHFLAVPKKLVVGRNDNQKPKYLTDKYSFLIFNLQL